MKHIRSGQDSTDVKGTASYTFTPSAFRDNHSQLSKTVRERVDEWYISPLKQMGEAEGLIILMILCPLYEKYLRHLHQMASDAGFSENHKAIITIGKQLNLSASDAYLFWRNVRNGLLHHAVINEDDGFRYVITHVGNDPVTVDSERVFWINPKALRKTLLARIEQSTNMWKEDEFKLPVVFRPIS